MRSCDFSDYGITIKADSGETKTTCPKCSHTRKKKNYPCLNVNVDEGVWNCWHCGWGGGLGKGEFHPAKISRTWVKPKDQMTGLSSQWLEWLKKRGISKQTAEQAKLRNTKIWMPQVEAEVDAIMFPYYRGGELTNAKYRDRNKNFRLSAGAERILFGVDRIDDGCLIWVEGEMDCLSVMEAGFQSCVSVPDGAPAVESKEYQRKFAFMESSMEILDSVKMHIIAVDGDAPGRKLQDELIRRLGPDKCWVVSWPKGIKDANELLVRDGKEALEKAIRGAKVCPVEGVFHVEDLVDDIMGMYEDGPTPGMRLGWHCLDELYTVRPGEWTVVTGIPGHGKSEWLDAAMVNLAIYHGWRFAICSPENQPLREHFKKLAEKYIGKPMDKGPTERMSPQDVYAAMDWANEHFSFVLPEEPTMDCILELARVEIRRRGCRGMVIDPWNELDHSRPPGLTETEYISQCLSKLRRFARLHQIHLWIVAHPTKMKKDDNGGYPVPTPYDISGSANWRNKADNAISVWRDISGEKQDVEIHIQKVRFRSVGKVGCGYLRWNSVTGRYWDSNHPRNTNEEQGDVPW